MVELVEVDWFPFTKNVVKHVKQDGANIVSHFVFGEIINFLTAENEDVSGLPFIRAGNRHLISYKCVAQRCMSMIFGD